MAEREDRCERCRFWEEFQDSDGWGHCHRYAPRPVVDPLRRDEEGHAYMVAYWPETDADEWCGEFQPLPLVQMPRPTLPAGPGAG